MTEENVNLYEKLDNEFHETCEHIVKILNEYECFRIDDILNANKYTLYEKVVECYDTYRDEICGTFDRKYLTMTDGQIRHAAKQKNDECLAEFERQKEKDKAEKENAEYQQYLELKQKFGNS